MMTRMSLALFAALLLAACGAGANLTQAPVEPPAQEDPATDEPQKFTVTIVSTPELDGSVSTDAKIAPTRPDQRAVVGDTAAPTVVGLRALFSFDTSPVPDEATILEATLRLTSSRRNGDPAKMMNDHMFIDHVRYGTFFPTRAGDPSLLLIQQAIGTWRDVNTLGPRKFDVTNRVLTDRLAPRKLTQFRVRGLNETDNDAQLDTVQIVDAEDPRNTGDVPVLVITYEIE